jgi:quinol monooxygenase YgiN
MTQHHDPLPEFLAETPRLGSEISITGKWIPIRKSGVFRPSTESKAMLKEWEGIHADAKADPGVKSTEINHAVGGDALLIHQVFADAEALVHYFSTTATQHMGALLQVAKPDVHIVRGTSLPAEVRDAITAKQMPAVFGEHLFGYVKDDYQRPNQENAINVTAKWTCKADDAAQFDELKYWWQQVGTDAHSLEKGLIRFEAYQVVGENALIIHEVFENTAELKFHLMKGTAKKYKKEIDQVAVPERYFFRGPVSWLIRTYSKVLRLPATYPSLGSNYTSPGGTMSDGTID